VRKATKRFVLLAAAIGTAAGLAGCRKVPAPKPPPHCEQGLEYRLRPSAKEPGRLMIHAVTNCSASTTWWINRRFIATVGVYGELSEVQLQILDSRGHEAKPDCLMDISRPEASDYAVLRPGETLEAEGGVFNCTDAKLGIRYRVRGVFRDKNPLPPPAPIGAVLFTGEATSNECELQNLDYVWEKWREESTRGRDSPPALRSRQETRRSGERR